MMDVQLRPLGMCATAALTFFLGIVSFFMVKRARSNNDPKSIMYLLHHQSFQKFSPQILTQIMSSLLSPQVPGSTCNIAAV